MMSPSRNGNFTNSEIFRLMSNGKAKDSKGDPYYSYIEECNYERRLGRSIETEIDAKPLSWGKLLEPYAFNLLGIEYKLCSQETLRHPTIPYWLGSPDAQKFDEGLTIVDYKAPYTLKSFCQLVAPLYDGLTGMAAMDALRKGYKDSSGKEHDKHKEGERYFQQLVGNAEITKSAWAELVIFMPYKSELELIRELAQQDPIGVAGNVYWIAQADDDHLPWLRDGGTYKNLNIIRFPVSNVDKWSLRARVEEAGKELIEQNNQPNGN